MSVDVECNPTRQNASQTEGAGIMKTDSDFFYNLANRAATYAERCEREQGKNWPDITERAWKRSESYALLGDAWRAKEL